MHSVARLLVATGPVDVAVAVLSAVPTLVGLHAIVVSHSVRSAYGTAHIMAVVVAVATVVSVAIVPTRLGIAVLLLLLKSPAIVAAPTAVVSAHDVCLVGAHRLRPALVLAIDCGLE